MKLINIQIGRGIAAILVVIHHLLLPQMQMIFKDASFFEYVHLNRLGDFAVYFFFCISGYVMMLSCSRKERNSSQFMKDRIFRIYPLYIICSAVSIIVYILTRDISPWLINLNYIPQSFIEYICSFLLLPPLWHGESFALPLATAWSLVYEMYFYFIFALALTFIRLKNIPYFLLLFFFGCFVIINSIYEPLRHRWVYWPFIVSDFINISFAMGALFFLLSKKEVCNSIICWVGIVTTITLIAILPKIYMERIVLVILACVCFYFLLHAKPLCGRTANILTYLGNASYSIYLTHVVFNSLSWMLIKISPVFGVLLTFFAILFGCFIHEVLEKPIAKLLKKYAN